VRHLDPDDHALVLADTHRRQRRIHVAEVLFDRSTAHPRSDDVQECEHTRLRPVDHLRLQPRKRSPSRAARIHQRRFARTERVAVRLNRVVPVAVLRFRVMAPEHVSVDVDESWRHVESRCIDDRARPVTRNPRRDQRDLAACDGDVHHGIDPILRVDEVSVRDQQIEFGVLGRKRHRWNGKDEEKAQQTGQPFGPEAHFCIST
jgi:hypothetical protein